MAKPTTVIIGGLSGTGSTTAAKAVAKRLGYEHVYAGAIFRKMADEAGQSIVEYNETLKQHPEMERAIDDRLIDRARAGDVVLESRVLGWIVPPEVPRFSVWLTCGSAERLRRLRLREPNTQEQIGQRETSERQRYETLYRIDMDDTSMYDLVVDTTTIPAGQTSETILAAYTGS